MALWGSLIGLGIFIQFLVILKHRQVARKPLPESLAENVQPNQKTIEELRYQMQMEEYYYWLEVERKQREEERVCFRDSRDMCFCDSCETDRKKKFDDEMYMALWHKYPPSS